jgi:hypothetical protein
MLGAGQWGGKQNRAQGEDDAWMEKEQEVDGGGLHSGGQGSGTGGGAEEIGENRAEEHVLGEEEEKEGDPGTCLQNLRITGAPQER